MSKREDKLSLAMIALKTPALPKVGPWLNTLLKKGDTPGLSESGILSFNTPTGWVAISLMEIPLPWSELETPCAHAYLWPDAEKSLRKHAAHLIVTVTDSKGDTVDRFLTLTKVIAALLDGFEVAGIYWGAGGVVQSPEIFREFAGEATREFLPLHLWIGFRIGRNKDKSLWGYTVGLEALGHMELEVLRSGYSGEDLIDRLFNCAHYLLDNGPILKDGNTFGLSAEEKIKIRHLPSEFGRKGKVIQLQFS